MKFLPIAADGWRFILPLMGGGIILLFLRHGWALALGTVLFVSALFCIYFFRDFDREILVNESLIYSPGDGRILDVSTIGEGTNRGRQLVRIFLSVFDVHVQRSPVAGRVDKIIYKKGVFLDARNDQAHLQNEQNTIVIAASRGPVEISQIAGLIARRIVCWVKEGQTLDQGERFGLIRFGSQVDLVVPAEVEIRVKLGDRVVGGETIIGHWRK